MNTTIRELKYSDRRKLSEMIKKLSVKMKDSSLLNSIVSEPKKTADEVKPSDGALVNFGMELFNNLLEFLEEDVTEWFADLLEVDIETFMKEAPFEIEILIIEQLMDEKGKFKSFLAGASKLYNSIKKSLGNLKIPSEQ